MPQIHKIRSAIVAPLSAAVLALFVLLSLAWSAPSLPGERAVLTALFVVLAYLLLEVTSRQVNLRDEGLVIRKFLRKNELLWGDITHLGLVVMSAKVYILLTTTRGFYILSNNYEEFTELLQCLRTNLTNERVDKEIADLIERPHPNNKPVLSAWLILAVVIAVIALRLFTV